MQNTESSGKIELECAADLSRHQRAVNVVRWSPNGELLASGDDESVILIWKLKSENENTNILGEFSVIKIKKCVVIFLRERDQM